MNKNKKIYKIIKIAFFILLVAIFVFLTIKLFPIFKTLMTNDGRLEFKNQISDMGIMGMFCIIVLHGLQMIFAFLPGEPIEILAGMCYGTIGGMIILFVSVFITTTIIFFSTRKFGKSFILSFVGKDKIKDIENIKLEKNKTKLEIFMVIMYFLPGSPKDILTYIAGLLPINPIKFILIATFLRFPSIISSTFAGSNLIDGNYTITIIAFLITGILSILGIYIGNKIQNKTIQK